MPINDAKNIAKILLPWKKKSLKVFITNGRIFQTSAPLIGSEDGPNVELHFTAHLCGLHLLLSAPVKCRFLSETRGLEEIQWFDYVIKYFLTVFYKKYYNNINY